MKGHWVAIGDRVICKPVQERVPDERLIDAHKGHKVEMKYQDRGRVVTGGKSKGIKKDDLVSFNPRYLEKYDFSGTEYYLMARNLDDISTFIRYIVRKEKGVYLTYPQITANLDAGQLDCFADWFKPYGVNQEIHDALRPFRVYQP